MDDFSKRLKEMRKKRGLSQADITNVINIPRTTYANYEAKNCDPNISTLIKLADFYNISVDELVGRETDMLNLNLLDSARKELVLSIVNSSDSLVNRLDAFYQGIKLAEEEREEIVKRIKGQGKNEQ